MEVKNVYKGDPQHWISVNGDAVEFLHVIGTIILSADVMVKHMAIFARQEGKQWPFIVSEDAKNKQLLVWHKFF
jgi:hypothetical protein